jgi:hypothetical protein
MKRALRWGLLTVLVVLALGLGALAWLDSLTRAAVEHGGRYALGVETTLEEARVGLLAGEFGLTGLEVANPPGFAQPCFFSLRSARLELPLRRLLEDRVTIPALELEGVSLDLERGAQGTNFGRILEHLSRFESASGAPEDGAAKAEGKTYHVQRLLIRDIRASVQLIPAGGALTKLEVAVPAIAVDDLASDMTLAQICAVVVEVVLRAALEAGHGVVPAELLGELRGRLDGLQGLAQQRLTKELEDLGEKLGQRAQDLGPGAEKALQKAGAEFGERFDGLLKKKKKD